MKPSPPELCMQLSEPLTLHDLNMIRSVKKAILPFFFFYIHLTVSHGKFFRVSTFTKKKKKENPQYHILHGHMTCKLSLIIFHKKHMLLFNVVVKVCLVKIHEYSAHE